MSLLAQLPHGRGATDHPTKGLEPQHTYKPSGETYDDTRIEHLYAEKDQTVTAPEHQKKLPSMDAPVLPEKSSLRASRMLDMDMKFRASIHSAELSVATPHDVYLSSEEDASSSADEFDFSDYDYDSESEDAQSPRRLSHEVTARVVSVVFMGKPSIIDLPASRRSVSPNSIEARRRASTVSSFSPASQRTRTPTESIASSIHMQSPPRKSSLVSSLLAKKKPLFLSIDPYANGSTYSLEVGPKQEADESAAPKTPRTPTSVLKNMSRTLSLARKRSRPVLDTSVPPAAAAQTWQEDRRPQSPAPASAPPPARAQTDPFGAKPQPPLPSSPAVTYNDIIKAAKKNSLIAPPPPQQHPSHSHAEPSPVTPTAATARRGILGGLAARRRSVKLMGQ